MASNVKPGLVLLSGGMDSTVLLHHVAKVVGCGSIYVLSLDYGQKHTKELGMARWQVAQLPAVREHVVIDLRFYSDMVAGASTLLTSGGAVPPLTALSRAELDQPPTYVPNRNMLLLSLAAAMAESRGCQTVYYGAQAQDEYGYWDCTLDFVTRINQLLSLNRRNPVSVEAPFVQMKKSEVLRLGLELGVDMAHTWSCYRGGDNPCTSCPTCVERQNAFVALGKSDPLMEAQRPNSGSGTP